MKTKLTEMLGIKYPILCGSLYGLTDAKLVSAVAEAGGLSFLSSSHLKSADMLKDEIEKTKALTDKPFGVNVSMLQESKSDLSQAFLKVIIDEKIPVVETAGKDPTALIEALKPHGIKIIHKVVAAKHAMKAQEAGADAITIIGYSAGGHPGMIEHGLWINLQDAVKKLDIPVIAAGGICDGKGLASALCMGAQGVLMGTAFALSEESAFSKEVKERMFEATAEDTIVLYKSVRNAFRCLNNDVAKNVIDMEARKAPPNELFSVLKDTDVKASYMSGEVDTLVLPTGKIVGMIHETKTCKALIEDMVNTCQEQLSLVHQMINQ